MSAFQTGHVRVPASQRAMLYFIIRHIAVQQVELYINNYRLCCIEPHVTLRHYAIGFVTKLIATAGKVTAYPQISGWITLILKAVKAYIEKTFYE
jgi:hypothetical protein